MSAPPSERRQTVARLVAVLGQHRRISIDESSVGFTLTLHGDRSRHLGATLDEAAELAYRHLIVDEPYDAAGTPGKACTVCNTAWPASEPESHARGCVEEHVARKTPGPITWYARARGVARMGGYATQLDAWNALRGHDGLPVPEATVWCETTPILDDVGYEEPVGARGAARGGSVGLRRVPHVTIP